MVDCGDCATDQQGAQAIQRDDDAAGQHRLPDQHPGSLHGDAQRQSHLHRSQVDPVPLRYRRELLYERYS